MYGKMQINRISGDPLYQFVWDFVDANMYVLVHGKNALVIDPNDSMDGQLFLKQNNISCVTVLLTHEHFDHISGTNWLKDNFDCTVITNCKCAEHIKLPQKNLSDKTEVLRAFNAALSSREDLCTINPFSCNADITFQKTYDIGWFGHSVHIIETPGHTPGSVCIILDKKIIFSGDTLLKEYKTITRLPGGDKKLFKNYTLPLLKKYETDEVIVYPGHGEPGDISDMICLNQN